MTQPHPRRILLAVTGLSPQVVTETLYALGVGAGQPGQGAFIPTEVRLITTTEGAKIARTALLHPDGGQFHALLRDYPQLGQPVLLLQGARHLHLHRLEGHLGVMQLDHARLRHDHQPRILGRLGIGRHVVDDSPDRQQ